MDKDNLRNHRFKSIWSGSKSCTYLSRYQEQAYWWQWPPTETKLGISSLMYKRNTGNRRAIKSTAGDIQYLKIQRVKLLLMDEYP